MPGSELKQVLAGFTLIEMMLVLSLTFLLCGLSYTLFQSLGHQNQWQMLQDSLRQGLKLAAVHALKSQKTVYLLPLSARQGWTSGFKIMQDASKPETLLYQQSWDLPGWQIEWQGASRQANQIPVAPIPGEQLSNGQWTLITPQGQKCLRINRLGRLKTCA